MKCCQAGKSVPLFFRVSVSWFALSISADWVLSRAKGFSWVGLDAPDSQAAPEHLVRFWSLLPVEAPSLGQVHNVLLYSISCWCCSDVLISCPLASVPSGNIRWLGNPFQEESTLAVYISSLLIVSLTQDSLSSWKTIFSRVKDILIVKLTGPLWFAHSWAYLQLSFLSKSLS